MSERNPVDALVVCMSSALSAAQNVHTAACQIDGNHAVQSYLSDAMHSLLIVAEECRQGLAGRRGLS